MALPSTQGWAKQAEKPRLSTVQQGDGEQLRSMDERPAVCLRNHQVTILVGNMVKDRTKPFHLAKPWIYGASRVSIALATSLSASRGDRAIRRCETAIHKPHNLVLAHVFPSFSNFTDLKPQTWLPHPKKCPRFPQNLRQNHIPFSWNHHVPSENRHQISCSWPHFPWPQPGLFSATLQDSTTEASAKPRSSTRMATTSCTTTSWKAMEGHQVVFPMVQTTFPLW